MRWLMEFVLASSLLSNGCAYIPLSMFPTDPKKMEEVRVAEESKRARNYNSVAEIKYRR